MQPTASPTFDEALAARSPVARATCLGCGEGDVRAPVADLGGLCPTCEGDAAAQWMAEGAALRRGSVTPADALTPRWVATVLPTYAEALAACVAAWGPPMSTWTFDGVPWVARWRGVSLCDDRGSLVIRAGERPGDELWTIAGAPQPGIPLTSLADAIALAARFTSGPVPRPPLTP